MLQFLKAEKRKYVYTIGLTRYWPGVTIFAIEKAKTVLRYTGQVSSIRRALYIKCKNRYFQLDRPQVYVVYYILSEKISSFNRPGLRYTFRLIFFIRK